MIVYVCAAVGASVLATLAVLLLVRVVGWLRWHVLRRSPVRWQRLTLDNVHQLKVIYDWDVRLGGFIGKRGGVGFVWGSPPIYGCDHGCDVKFRTMSEAELHERSVHPDAGHA